MFCHGILRDLAAEEDKKSAAGLNRQESRRIRTTGIQ
jgi:hypothetical protein